MPITLTGGELVETRPEQEDRQNRTNVHRDDGFAICDEQDPLKQIQFDASQISTDTTVTIKAPAATADQTISLRQEPIKEGIQNIGLAAATTSAAADSVKITSADGTALSVSNLARIVMQGATAGQLAELEASSDVTIDLTGAHFGLGTGGDLTDKVLHVYAINDAGTLKFGVARDGNLTLVDTANDTATPTSATSKASVLVNSALSASAVCLRIGSVKANFDDTGGASEDLWAVQTGSQDIEVSTEKVQTTEIVYSGQNGYGTDSSNKIWRLTTQQKDEGDIAFADVAASGSTFTIGTSGLYNVCLTWSHATLSTVGVTRNASTLTTAAYSQAVNEIVCLSMVGSNTNSSSCSRTLHLDAGDILRVHGDGTSIGTGPFILSISRIQ